MIPVWLYKKRVEPYLTIRRFGSRRPLGVVLTILSGGDMPPSVLFAIGKFGVQHGPADGVDAGHGGMPEGSRCRLFEYGRRGMAVGLSWDGGRRV